MRDLFRTFVAALILGNTPLHADFNVQAAEESTFRILNIFRANDGDLRLATGSGFLLNNQGYLATNVHVIDGTEKLFVVQARGNQINFWEASVHSKHPGKDLAILRIPGLNGRPVVFPAEEPKKATEVYAVGFPGQADDDAEKQAFLDAMLKEYGKKEGNHIPMDPAYDDFVNTSIKQGFIESLRSRDWGFPKPSTKCRVIYHNTPITGGNSGGPLFNKEGQVVGINTQGQGEGRAGGVLLGNVIAQSSVFTELVHILKSESIPYNTADATVSVPAPTTPTPAPTPPSPTPTPSAPVAGEIAPQDPPRSQSVQKRDKPLTEKLAANFSMFKGSGSNAWLAPALIFLGIGVAAFAIFIVARSPGSRPQQVAAQPAVTPVAPGIPQADPRIVAPARQHGRPVCRLAGTNARGAPIQIEIGERELSNPDGCTLGRGADAVCRIDDDSISRIHVKIKWSRKGLYVSDAGSSNGSTVNGKPLKPKLGVVLHTGDRIGLGNVNLLVKEISASPQP
ncbi:MAG TPA: trypsin-like peptidase domain-containing protein [Luteolibacter sp.]|nr:trypsin-like peptidase domain-containing protein [Luteolibacter sp.]